MFNEYVYDNNRTAPILNLKDESHYSFETPNDRGTGSRYKGLILFDMSMLKRTKLPVVVHDSFLLNQIEDSVLEKLCELYSKSEKQIFISMDKGNSYTKRTEELLEGAVVKRPKKVNLVTVSHDEQGGHEPA